MNSTKRTKSLNLSQHQANEIKPSDVHELKLKTQQILLKTRQLRTQLNRLNDKITAKTNAINKTFEQQSGQSPIVTNHSNSVPQLQRSVELAENTLSSLKEEIEAAYQDDKTFIVKELEEEVKLAYCENQRLSQEAKEARQQSNSTSKLLKDATYKASNQNIQELRSSIRDIQETNASLRDKSFAYSSKNEKLRVDQTILENEQNKVSHQKAIDDANKKKEELTEKLNKKTEKIEKLKQDYQEKIDELNQIIQKQKQVINDFLSGNYKPKEEKEKDDNKSDDDMNQ
ncbi:hypothetical protein GPJ56_004742 [Histomonas meleagridis]|uniref:uncharacterized protein n=1 Tax=Histomonas meleagridis TaxID=135588 RepID=UPI00355A32C0|nr:hypothetical protein GPJ56_004742 [Histomonas meleagridis]KAH0803091.1 hypothetical protein GO595_004184 [Histomonas meleagridis]